MFLSNRLRPDTVFSARISDQSEKHLKQTDTRTHSQRRAVNNKNERPKVQFRKIIISRANHSRVHQTQQNKSNRLNQSRITYNSDYKCKEFSVRQNQVSAMNLSQQNNNKEQKQPKQLKQHNLSNKKMLSFINKLGNAKLLKQKQVQQKSQIQIKRQSKVQTSRVSSALSHRSKHSNFKFFKEDFGSHKEQNKIKQHTKSSRILREDKSSRPLSSASSYSSLSKIRNDLREDVQLGSNEKTNTARKNSQTQRSFYTKTNQTKTKLPTWQEIVEQFESTQQRINNLIQQKWNFIEQKLMSERQSAHKINKKQKNHQLKHRETQSSSSRLSKQSQSKLQFQEKYSFSHAIAQKNTDLQIMNEIKKLRSLDFSKILLSQDQPYESNIQIMKQKLQKRRSQIIQKALAQSMVEAQLIKKYYSGQNYNGLSNSNHKVGQQSTKNKIILKNSKSSLNPQMKFSLQRTSEHRDSVTKQSQSNLFDQQFIGKVKFSKHNQQDYEKYRYKHPNFKPNLQPLPRSAYNCQFFSYGNIKAFDDPYKQEHNMIFPTTNGLTNSSYRSQYKQLSPQKINYKQLDAYRDKFKQLNIMYLPKKRSESQANRHKNSVKFTNQLQYVKRLKTQSLIQDVKHKQIAQKVAKKMFMTESRKQFENPQNLPQQYAKSQIKHKNLFTLKYDFKKKVHA